MSGAVVARRGILFALGIGAYLVSCREVPAPEGGIIAISPLILPLPGLVAGDTMRDSTGVVAPLRVIAYGTDGEPLDPQPTPSFVVLDTTAHFAGALLVGDSVGSARVVGVVGNLQTRTELVRVTLTPDTLVAADSTLHRKSFSITGPADTVVNSADLSVLVRHLLPTVSGVEAVVVRYTIDHAPPINGPTLLLMNGNRVSTRDTTDASGRAARVARLRLTSTAFQAETVTVSATASYRGRVLGPVTFTIIYTKQ